ncbi:hypothetical protein A33K_13476 [Burkholderia humptydooensis MSMB43]|uniref:Uncharacterized protein n=1 Tax=Burkholderia humptydooensis MSMB43 TaxID=441157 RepID=A0ABN0GCM1_9BURK|nr:hypothetical protein A33K_13476 [Burkholderia humptydooensis MSMB43]
MNRWMSGPRSGERGMEPRPGIRRAVARRAQCPANPVTV